MTWPQHFQPEVETAEPDPSELLALLNAQLERVYEDAPYYQELYDSAGFRLEQLKRLEDLSHVPFMTKQMARESQQADPPLGRHALAHVSDVTRMHLTSGTTGHPVFIGLTERDSTINSLVGARSFWAAGIRPDDIVLHCLNYSFYAGGVADHLAVERTGAAVVPVGIGQSRRLLELAEDLNPTAMFAITSYPFYLAEVAEEAGINPRTVGLRQIVVGGEPGGSLPETQAQLREIWGAEVSDTYGMAEVISTFASQCEEHQGLHFMASDVLYPELLDPDSAEPIPIEKGAEGEFVFTHLVKEATPLIRYRTGDMAHIMDTECPCGRTGFRFRVAGRTDDMFKVRGVNVFPSSIEAVVRKHIPAVTGEFAVLLKGPAPKPPVPILVETGTPDQDEVTRSLASQLAEVIRRDLQFTTKIVMIPPGSLKVSQHKTPRIFRLYAGDKLPVDVDIE